MAAAGQRVGYVRVSAFDQASGLLQPHTTAPRTTGPMRTVNWAEVLGPVLLRFCSVVACDYTRGSGTDSREAIMSTADTYVRARIGTNTKERAADALEAMGLPISDAIRLLMLRVADERRLPFDVKAPNAITRKAIAELEAGKGKRFASVDDLMADLHAND